MMRKIAFFIGLLLLKAVVPVQAVNEEYHLHVPSAAEYLAAVPGIMAQMQTDDTSEYQRDTYELRRLLNEEFWKRYDDLSLVPFNVLNAAEPYIDRTFDYDVTNPETEPGWHNLLLNLWLKAQQPDLSTRDVWQFGDYILHVQPVDFTGDGIDELAAQFVYQPGGYAQFTEYLVLQQDRSRLERYRRLGDTHFWFSTRCFLQTACGGDGKLYKILDLTGDGLPEWIITTGQCGWGRCGVTLSVFGWWHGHFVDLTQSDSIGMQVVSGGGGVPTYPREGDWIIKNVDGGSALEIKQVERITDNRGCEFSSEQIFKWDEFIGQFQGGKIVFEYADTPWCALRLAHDAMIDGDPEAASIHYEHMLTFNPPPDLTDLWQYARIRLAAAYALSERVEDAKALLNEIDPTAIDDETIRSMAETAQSVITTNSDGKRLCASLEESVADAYNKGTPAPILLAYGQTNDYAVSSNYGGGDFSPANAGCNIQSLWTKTVNELKDDGNSLKDQIEAAGWNVTGEFEFDINNDGINEILVWTDLTSLAAFQLSDSQQLYYSTAPVSQPTEYTQLAMIALPDTGNFLVDITFNPDIECQIDRNDQPGEVYVWRLDQHQLTYAGYQAICAPQTIAETFPNSSEMHLKSTLYGDNLVLSWDAKQLIFTLPPENQLPPESHVENPLSCYRSIYGFCGSLDNPKEALELIQIILSNPQEDTSPQFIAAFKYYRALSLETLGQDDEALAAYVSIYEAAPESTWGMLAGLHLERVEGK